MKAKWLCRGGMGTLCHRVDTLSILTLDGRESKQMERDGKRLEGT